MHAICCVILVDLILRNTYNFVDMTYYKNDLSQQLFDNFKDISRG